MAQEPPRALSAHQLLVVFAAHIQQLRRELRRAFVEPLDTHPAAEEVPAQALRVSNACNVLVAGLIPDVLFLEWPRRAGVHNQRRPEPGQAEV